MRIFIAVDVEPAIKQKMLAVSRSIDTSGAKVQWTKPEQLHLTLKFIGEMEDARIPTVCQHLQHIASQINQYEMTLEGVGCFPLSGPVRIIWIGGHGPSEALPLAVQEIEEFLEPMGVPRETRTFSEHFTIGRVKFDATHGKLRAAVQAAAFGPVRQRVRAFVLYQSVLKPSGVEYVPICRADLQA